MVVQSLADVDFDPERGEISVFSKYSFSGHDKRIVGAVSVIFIQNDESYSPDGKTSDSVVSQKTKIPTSLSVIYLPQFGDILSGKSSQSNSTSKEPFSDLVSQKFVENLNLSSSENSGVQMNQNSTDNADISEITDKSGEIQSDLKLDSILPDDASKQDDVEIPNMEEVQDKVSEHIKEGLSNPQNPDSKVMVDVSTNQKSDSKMMVDVSTNQKSDSKMMVDVSTNQKSDSKVMVDVSTNTDLETENVFSTVTEKTFVDASTCVSMDDHDNTEDSIIPMKRKRMDSIEFTDTENDSASMFIITENKSSDSESQDSVEFDNAAGNSLNENTDSNSYNNVKDRLSPSFSCIAGSRQDVEPSTCSRESEFIVIEGNNMEICENDKTNEDNEEGFENPGNVSVVDLSNVPVSYANLSSDQMPKTLSIHNQKSHSVYKTSANMYSENSLNSKQDSVRGQESSLHQVASGNQRPKFMRSTSFQKGVNRNVIEKCKVCKRTVTSLADMFHHSKIHNMGIKCCVCGMKAFDWNVMKHHYTWHIQRAAYRCPQCSITVGSRDLLAAHLKTHTAAKSMIHLKNPKLRPPASKLILSQPRTNEKFQNIPNLSAINRPVSKTITYSANSVNDKSTQERQGFVPFRQHMSSIPETVFNHSDQSQGSSSSHVDIKPPQNVNQILNYSCGCCDEKFVNVEKLKRHVLMYHSEQTMSAEQQSDSSYPTYRISTSNRNYIENENSASSSSAISYPPENINIKQEPEVIDIEQLGKFTENMENSMSTSSSDQFSQDFNQTSEQLEKEIMSSFMDTSQSPTNRQQQRKTSCRLANVIPVCRFCGIFLNNWSEILDHRFSHPEEIGQQLACTVCSSVLSTRDSLKRHAINHMGIRHQCQFCHHEYSRKDSLMNHMRSAHGYLNHV